MKKSITKSLLLTTLLTSSVVWGGAPAFAEESLNEYSIDEIVVTATRTEKRDVDVPATTEIKIRRNRCNHIGKCYQVYHWRCL